MSQDAQPAAEAAIAVERELDTIGLACPLPVLKARKALARMRAGERLRVLASDPMAAIDIPHLCRQDGHRLLAEARADAEGGPVLRFVIERGEAPRNAAEQGDR